MERISAQDYQLEVDALKKKKRSKYGNKKTTLDGHTFDSAKEMRRYSVLKLRQQAGEIKNLQLQPRFNFTRPGLIIEYESGRVAAFVADFSYNEVATGELVVEDVKSEITREIALYRLKKAMMRAFFGIEVQEV